jgi:hypothetical protein
MKKKILFTALAVILISAVAIWYYIFVYSVHHRRSAANETSIAITANNLVKEYQTNEADSNAKYLNKALKITGIVKEVKKDQTGKLTITIQSEDAFTSVFCTLKNAATKEPAIGETITVLGFCTGFLSDVVINEATIVQP